MAKQKYYKRKIVMSSTAKVAHQRIDDHEKLCRIMQQETNNKIHSLKNQIIRLEKIVVISAGLLIAGMGTIIIELFRRV